jgi:hypothetical protein
MNSEELLEEAHKINEEKQDPNFTAELDTLSKLV